LKQSFHSSDSNFSSGDTIFEEELKRGSKISARNLEKLRCVAIAL